MTVHLHELALPALFIPQFDRGRTLVTGLVNQSNLVGFGIGRLSAHFFPFTSNFASLLATLCRLNRTNSGKPSSPIFIGTSPRMSGLA